VELIIGGSDRYHHIGFDSPPRCTGYEKCISPVAQS
jgi:hypothetical protein